MLPQEKFVFRESTLSSKRESVYSYNIIIDLFNFPQYKNFSKKETSFIVLKK